MPYRLSSRAEQDLDEAWLYVAEDASPTTADRLIDEIVDRFDLLAEPSDTTTHDLLSSSPRGDIVPLGRVDLCLPLCQFA